MTAGNDFGAKRYWTISGLKIHYELFATKWMHIHQVFLKVKKPWERASSHRMPIQTKTASQIGKRNLDTMLFPLPCACQNLRRLTRLVTRIYDEELRKGGIEVTHFGLLTALAAMGEANQKTLSAGFAMDSTTLTRTLALLRRQGWISVRPGKDRRERVFRLTEAGKRELVVAQSHWQKAERRLRKALGSNAWNEMRSVISEITLAASTA